MIASGTFLIERGAPRPRCFEVEASCLADFLEVQAAGTASQELERELSATGWTFFFMAGPISKTAFGFDRERTVYAALRRGVKDLRELKCNCLQIESVGWHSFLGIPYVKLSIRPRHIQKGMLFVGSSHAAGAGSSEHELYRHVVAT